MASPVVTKLPLGDALAVVRMRLWHLFDRVLIATMPMAHSNSVAVLRLDAIGDFVVWQVYARFLREAYPGRKIVLLCNPACIDLASALPFWDDVLPLETSRMSRGLVARWRGFRRLRRHGFEITINPVFSRTARADAVVRGIGSPIRIGVDGDHANMPPHLKMLADRCYTRLVESPRGWLPEAERARLFMGALLERDIPFQWPKLPVVGAVPAGLPKTPYFVVFPGAASAGRRWPPSRFISVGAWICETRGWTAVVAGGPDDVERADEICRGIGGNALNFAGRTSVRELVECVRHAALLIANETSAVHIAAAVSTPAVAILGGGHFKRFMPYPALHGLPLSAFEAMPCFQCNWDCIYPTLPLEPKPCVTAVGVDVVKGLVDQALMAVPSPSRAASMFWASHAMRHCSDEGSAEGVEQADRGSAVARPLFSIATPTRNALAKLKRCVGSVRGQIGVSFEHLIQDADSSDGSPAWLMAQPSLLAVSQPDDGMYDAINRAWSRSRGRYLSWLNADEQYLPGTLARVHSFFEANSDVDAVFADYLVADGQGRAVALRREIPLRRFYVANSFLNAQSCTLFYRRELWDRGLLRLDSAYRYAADKDLVLRLLAAGARFRHLPEVLAVFGIDGSNLSTHADMGREAEAIRIAYGGFRMRPLRGIALAGRRVERLLRGAYRAVDFGYRYAIDEMPTYVDYRTREVGGRYSLSQTEGRADTVPTSTSAAANPGKPQ